MGAPRSTVLVGRGVRRLDAHHADDDADAVLVVGADIAWIGAVDDAPGADERLDVDGWITPGFVDAHVHATATGLAVDGLDLSTARSLADALQRVRAHAAASDDDPLLGGGWEETRWPEQRPPTAQELTEAAPGRRVMLERVDGHSCVVDATVLARTDVGALPLEVVRDRRGAPTGWLKEGAAESVRRRVHAGVEDARWQRARTAACSLAASLGITSLHEMGHPGLSGLDDALAWARGDWPVDVQVWWAALDGATASDHGLHRGGDLFLDGSIGSHTAAVTAPYLDADPGAPGGGRGLLFHPDEAVAAFFADATGDGVGAGVHAIGGRAIEQALRAVQRAVDRFGVTAVRACRHRVEHVEMPTTDQITRMADMGVVASVQPAFDAVWGGPDGLYARRFGPDAAARTNPLRALADAGVRLAFGSDSTVTPLDPWGGVAAAERHRGGHALDRLSAWRAHTIGGREVAHQEHRVGPVRQGLQADLAVWDHDPLRCDDVRALRCLATFVAGRQAHWGGR